MRRFGVVVAALAVVALASCSGAVDPATNVTATTATLNAHGDCDGGTPTPCEFRWRYRPQGTSTWTETPLRGPVTSVTPRNVHLEQDVTGLTPSTTYEVQVGGRGDNVSTFTWQSSTTFTTSASSNDTPIPAPPSGWTRVGSEGFTTDGSGLPASFTQYPSNWLDTAPAGGSATGGGGHYGCEGGIGRLGGVLNFKLVGGKVCTPVFKDQGGSGVNQFGIPFGMAEGRYSVRFRVRSGASDQHKIAWLLWPDTDNFSDGEIDYPETDHFPDVIRAHTHRIGSSTVDSYSSGVTVGADDTWHVATIERKSGSVRYLMDGNVVGTSTSGLPTAAMHWVLQSETIVESSATPPDSEVTSIDVDWVSVDKPGTGTTQAPPTNFNGIPQDGQVALGWTAPSPAPSGYLLQVKRSSDASYDPANDALLDGSRTSFVADGLTNGISYDFRLYAVAGDGTKSTPATVTKTPTNGTTPTTHVLTAVGDICSGTSCDEGSSTANTVRAINPEKQIGLGDYQYDDDGSNCSTFNAGYASKWSGLHGITIPAFGATHDTEDHSGIWEGCILDFFNANGAPEVRGKLTTGGWGYSFDIGRFHFVVFNYKYSGGTAAVTADLDAHPSSCLVAVDHAPIIGSPTSEHPTNEAAAWRTTLVAHGLDLFLNGHQHGYERNLDPSGFTAITNGEGGIGHYSFGTAASTRQAVNTSAFGVVKITLTDTGWSTQYVPNVGSSFSDTASGTC